MTDNPQSTRIIDDRAWLTSGQLFTWFGISPERLEAARQAQIIMGVPTQGVRVQPRLETMLFSGAAINSWLRAGAPIAKQAR